MIFSPMAPLLAAEMGLSAGNTGSLFLTLSSGFAISLFSSQFISTILSHRKTILCSTIFLGCALMGISMASTITSFRIGLFVTGLAGGLFLPSAVAIISSLFDKDNLGKAFGIFAMAQSASFLTAPLIVQILHPALALNQILFLIGSCVMFIGLMQPIFFKAGQFKGETISLGYVRELLFTPSFWVAVFLLCLINGLNVGIYNMAPHYFSKNYGVAESTIHNFLVLARAIGVFLALISGAISDRIGLKKAIPIGFFLCGIMTFFMGSLPAAPALFIFCIQAPLAICLTPMVHHFISSLATPERNASMVSITAPFAFLFGAGVVPQILGFFGDMEIYALGFVLLGLLTSTSGLAFHLARRFITTETVEAEAEVDIEAELDQD